MNLLKKLFCKTQSKLSSAKSNMIRFAKDEQGDTNFVSILIILGIVLIVAVVFIGFKDQIVAWVEGLLGDFFDAV